MSPASDVSGFHLPALAAAVGLAVGARVGVIAAVAAVGATVGATVGVAAVAVVGAVVAVVTVAFVGAAVGALVGARVGPPLSRVRPVRAALADAVSRQNAVMRAQACGAVKPTVWSSVSRAPHLGCSYWGR